LEKRNSAGREAASEYTGGKHIWYREAAESQQHGTMQSALGFTTAPRGARELLGPEKTEEYAETSDWSSTQSVRILSESGRRVGPTFSVFVGQDTPTTKVKHHRKPSLFSFYKSLFTQFAPLLALLYCLQSQLPSQLLRLKSKKLEKTLLGWEKQVGVLLLPVSASACCRGRHPAGYCTPLSDLPVW
jgi:hypothetical protein